MRPIAAVAGIASLVALGTICHVQVAPAEQCPLIRPANGNQFVVGTPIEVEFEQGPLSNPPVFPGTPYYYVMGVASLSPPSFYYREFLEPREPLDAVVERHIISRHAGTFFIDNRYVITSSVIGGCTGNGTFEVIGGPAIPYPDGSVYPLPTPVVDPAVQPILSAYSSYNAPDRPGGILEGALTRDGSVTYLPDMIIRNEGTAELKLYDMLVPVGGEACRIEPMISIAGVTLQPGEEVRVPFVIIRRPDLLNGVFGMHITALIYSNQPSEPLWLRDDRIVFGVWDNAAQIPSGYVPQPSKANSTWEMYE